MPSHSAWVQEPLGRSALAQSNLAANHEDDLVRTMACQKLSVHNELHSYLAKNCQYTMSCTATYPSLNLETISYPSRATSAKKLYCHYCTFCVYCGVCGGIGWGAPTSSKTAVNTAPLRTGISKSKPWTMTPPKRCVHRE
eukprot:295054-Amphidinium_carterae.1